MNKLMLLGLLCVSSICSAHDSSVTVNTSQGTYTVGADKVDSAGIKKTIENGMERKFDKSTGFKERNTQRS